MSEWEKLPWVNFEVKSLAEDSDRYLFEGHASVFNTPDKVKDRVRPGAFKRTIDHHKGQFPLTYLHDLKNIIGGANMVEDSMGFKAEPGFILKGLPDAERIYRLMKAKVINGMSFMYRVIQYKMVDGFRDLLELHVGEVTVGPRTLICHPDALITNIKAFEVGDWDDVSDIIGWKIWDDNPEWTEIRYRIRDPGLFLGMKRWEIQRNSIDAVGGKLKSDSNGGMVIQALRFKKEAGWTLTKAQAWVKEHSDMMKMYDLSSSLQYELCSAAGRSNLISNPFSIENLIY